MDKKGFTQIVLIVLVTVLVFSNIFQNKFVVDDSGFISWPEIKALQNIPNLLKGAFPKNHSITYRPLSSVQLAFNYYFWGENPAGYHLGPLFFHLLTTVFVYLLILEITKKKSAAFIGGLLFGLHPVHVEGVTYISAAIGGTSSAFFMLASLYFYIRRFYLISIVFAALSFFTHEITLVLIPILVLYDLCFRKFNLSLVKTYLLRYLPYVALAAGYFLVRLVLVGPGLSRGAYLADSFPLTMLTMTKVLVQYLWVLVWPVNLVNNHIISPGIEAFVYRNYRTAAIAAQSFFDLDILLSITIIIFMIFIIFILRKKHPIVSFCIGWFFISLLPVMELVPQGSMMNERLLYLASFGVVLITTYGLLKLKNKKLITFLTCLLVIFYGTRTFIRNRDWHDDISLWQADVRLSPGQNAYAYFALGNAYNDRKQYDLAIEQYAKSIEINPGFAVGWASLGRTYADMGKIAEAIANYKQALAIDPNFQEVKINLNNIYNKGL